MPKIPFSVDAALLRELGERLVGKPHIALAELIKNSYDADATKVTIRLDPKTDSITVEDNGNGMTYSEFRDFWMRVGSTHKDKERTSRRLHRPMTGSKGVGRLAVQFLASKLHLETVARKGSDSSLTADVDWEKAVKADELIHANADYHISENKEKRHFTKIKLKGLRHKWNKDSIRALASEIWWIQPPFRRPKEHTDEFEFRVTMESSQKEFERLFNRQMNAIMDIWHARVAGRNENGTVEMVLEFAGETPMHEKFKIPNCKLEGGDFEIRFFHLTKRQPNGIKVGAARKYFQKFGGVHVYDGGFRLPYYGLTTNDWLGIETDHAHRLTSSQLLPERLQVSRGLNFLPTNERMFGVVNVNTSTDRNLHIQITRDRLRDSTAYDNLVYMVRWAVDFYAMTEAVRSFKELKSQLEVSPPADAVKSLAEALDAYKAKIDKPIFKDLSASLSAVMESVARNTADDQRRLTLLGPLATAGISTLAYSHELTKQLRAVEGIIEDLNEFSPANKAQRRWQHEFGKRLSGWLERARGMTKLFGFISNESNRETKKRFNAALLLADIKSELKVLSRGVDIDVTGVDPELLLPLGTRAEWTAIFQNVLVNSFNALLDRKRREILIISRDSGRKHEILIQDSGVGVDLTNSAELFEPFVRKLPTSPERQALGYGGTGLGLAIVKLVAKSLGCTVGFSEPGHRFKTAFSLSWRELE